LKITEIAHNLGQLFLNGYVFAIFLTKMGYILGDFFTNSSGHPGPPEENRIEARLSLYSENFLVHILFINIFINSLKTEDQKFWIISWQVGK
jgi:hypothetical protein